MSSDDNPRWPIFIWYGQLIPSFGLLVVCVARTMSARPAFDPVTTYAAMGLGAAWTVGILVAARRIDTRRWVIHRRKQVLLASSAILLALVVVDLVLTASGAVPTIAAQQKRWVSYAIGWFTRLRMTTQDVLLDNDSSLHINGRGFRGPEITSERVEGRKRVVVLGGSQVFDYVGNWPGELESRLEGQGVDAEVINAGVPSHDTTDSLGKFLTDLWTLDPDVVILCQTWNDTEYIPQLRPEDPYRGLAPSEPVRWDPDWRIYPQGIDALFSASSLYRHFRWGFAALLYSPEGYWARIEANRFSQAPSMNSVGLRQFRLNVELIAELATSIGAELYLCRQARLATAAGTDSEQMEARSYGRRTTGLSHEALTATFDACHEILTDIAEERQLSIIDMDATMSGRGEYFVDGIHFSEKGSSVAAELATVAILPSLSDVAFANRPDVREN